jgi:hypothetical protein
MTTQTSRDTCRWTPPCEECGVTASKAKPRYSITRHGCRWMCRPCAALADAAEDAHRLFNVLRDVPMTHDQLCVVFQLVDDLPLAFLRRLALDGGYDDVAYAADSVFDDRDMRREYPPITPQGRSATDPPGTT